MSNKNLFWLINPRTILMTCLRDTIRGELYKGVGWGAYTFTSLSMYDNKKELWGGLEYKYPDSDESLDPDENPDSIGHQSLSPAFVFP